MTKQVEDLHERLQKKLYKNPKTKCWEFQGGKNNVGYGMIRISSERGMGTVHRVAYELYVDKIPPNMLVLHKCGVYTCCNPDHLELGNRYDLTHKLMETDHYNPFGKLNPDYREACTVCGHITTKRVLMYYHNDKCPHKAA